MAPLPGGSGEVARRNYWETGRMGPDIAETTQCRRPVNKLLLRPKPLAVHLPGTRRQNAKATSAKALFEKVRMARRGEPLAKLLA